MPGVFPGKEQLQELKRTKPEKKGRKRRIAICGVLLLWGEVLIDKDGGRRLWDLATYYHYKLIGKDPRLWIRNGKLGKTTAHKEKIQRSGKKGNPCGQIKYLNPTLVPKGGDVRVHGGCGKFEGRWGLIEEVQLSCENCCGTKTQEDGWETENTQPEGEHSGEELPFVYSTNLGFNNRRAKANQKHKKDAFGGDAADRCIPRKDSTKQGLFRRWRLQLTTQRED